MRWSQLNEDNGPSTEDEIIPFIKQHCQPYLKENPDFLETPLYRGIMGRFDFEIKSIRKDRKPLDTNPILHELYNETFKQAGFKTNRSNSMFVTPSKIDADYYGYVYVIFPIGDFNYLYSEEIKDLTGYTRHMVENGIIRFNNVDGKVLSHSNFTALSNDLEDSLPNIFSYNEFKQKCKELGFPDDYVVNQTLGMMNSNPEVLDLLEVDKKRIATNIKLKYTDLGLRTAVKGTSEIMISGGTYLAVSQHLFSSLWGKWK